MVGLDKFKLYARIDGTDEDALLTGFLSAAEQAVKDMTGKVRPGDTDDIYDICVMQLAAHWYTSRVPIETGTIVTVVDYTLQLLLNHISMGTRYPRAEAAANGTA